MRVYRARPTDALPAGTQFHPPRLVGPWGDDGPVQRDQAELHRVTVHLREAQASAALVPLATKSAMKMTPPAMGTASTERASGRRRGRLRYTFTVVPGQAHDRGRAAISTTTAAGPCRPTSQPVSGYVPARGPLDEMGPQVARRLTRSTIGARSVDLSNDATRLTPVDSAQVTRYAPAKSNLFIS